MWGENWNELVWGGGLAIPLLGPLGFVAMAISFALGGALMRSRLRSYWVFLLPLSTLVVLPLAALAFTFPHVFTNGTPADAGEVNANFAAVGVELDSLDTTIRDYVNQNCRIYVGWRDGCNGCTLPPSKWGSVGAGTCANGTGADNTCTSPNLGGQTIELFGLNFDGDVDGSDKLYLGFVCD